MMNLDIQRLSDENRHLIEGFSCVETDEMLSGLNAKRGLAMKVLKYQKAGAVEVIEATKHEMIDRETAVFLNRVAKLDLEFDEKGDQVDMCKAMEDNNRMREVTGAIKGMQLMGASETDIISKIVENYHVTKEYVLALLAPKQA